MFNNYQYEKLLYLTLIVAIEKELHLIKFYDTVNISNNKLLTLKAVFAFIYANTSGKTRIIKNIDMMRREAADYSCNSKPNHQWKQQKRTHW